MFFRKYSYTEEFFLFHSYQSGRNNSGIKNIFRIDFAFSAWKLYFYFIFRSLAEYKDDDGGFFSQINLFCIIPLTDILSSVFDNCYLSFAVFLESYEAS